MSTQIKTYKFKLKLNKSQEILVEEYLATCRALYNLALEARLYAYSSKKINWNYYDLSSQLTELRKEFDWVRKLPSNTCQDVLERQEKAFKAFYKGGGFPKFKSKGFYNSITFKNTKQISESKIRLEKLGVVKFFNSRNIEGQIRTCTIKKELDGYYLMVCSKIEKKDVYRDIESLCSVDVGIANLLVTSDGQYFENPKTLERLSKKLRVEQRSLSRKKKGSKSREKAKLKVAKTHLKIKRIRQDNLHKVTTEIANQYDYVVRENLSIDQMCKNKNLSKGIYDASWGKLFELLEYKTEVVKVNPAYSSQECSKCGHISKNNRKTQSEFKCVSCGFESEADFQACQNLLKRGRAALGIANVNH